MVSVKYLLIVVNSNMLTYDQENPVWLGHGKYTDFLSIFLSFFF